MWFYPLTNTDHYRQVVAGTSFVLSLVGAGAGRGGAGAGARPPRRGTGVNDPSYWAMAISFFEQGLALHHRRFVARRDDRGGLMTAVVAALEQRVRGHHALVGDAVPLLYGTT